MNELLYVGGEKPETIRWGCRTKVISDMLPPSRTLKTKYTVKGLKKKTTYYVRVRYYDGEGYSVWSKTKKIKTK